MGNLVVCMEKIGVAATIDWHSGTVLPARERWLTFSGLYLQSIHTCAYDQLIFGEEEAPHRSAQDPQSLKNHSDY